MRFGLWQSTEIQRVLNAIATFSAIWEWLKSPKLRNEGEFDVGGSSFKRIRRWVNESGISKHFNKFNIIKLYFYIIQVV